jgi:hypothetical protein
MQEALRFVQECELAPDLIATDGVKGQVQFEAPAHLTVADLKTYIEAFAEGVNIAPESLKLTSTRTAANEPCGLVTINTEN